MYGIVNQAIKGLLTEYYSEDTWLKVKEKTGVSEPYFISNQAYPDEITYKLAEASAAILNISVDQVLESFGKYWVLHTGRERYGALLESGGSNLLEFLLNLPNFHTRIVLMYPQLVPPSFEIEQISSSELYLYYFSKRKGLVPFLVGLLNGLSELFNEALLIENIKEHPKFENSYIFKIRL